MIAAATGDAGTADTGIPDTGLAGTGIADTDIANASIADAALAARLFVEAPARFGGLCLRGHGPVRDALVAKLCAALPAHLPVVRIPINVDAAQLLGGLDLAATLGTGRAVERPGLLARARGGVVILPMAERMAEDVAAHLAQAMDRGDIATVLLDDGIGEDEAPPAPLMARAALHCDLTAARDLDVELPDGVGGYGHIPPLDDDQRTALAVAAAALGIRSMRPLLFADRCARAHAALAGDDRGDMGVETEDLEAAIRLVLAPRATISPNMEPDAPPQEPDSPDIDDPDRNDDAVGGEEDTADSDRPGTDVPLEDILLAAAAAAIPKNVLEGIVSGRAQAGRGRMGRSGRKARSARRGRPRGSQPGVPGGGRRLALIDTLRAAAPWQGIRRAAADRSAHGPATDGLHIRKSDLHVRRFEQRRERLTIFAVDASGSAALSRLAEAKGAVELMLAEAHVKRSQVALIAFRQTGAETLLPPTRSLTRARRMLGALPGGGGTPLAAGLRDACQLADAAEARGQTPTIAVLTDGKANVTLDGAADRARAMKEAETAARTIAEAGHHAIVIDIAPRPREDAAKLAAMLHGKYLPLPAARSAAMVDAIEQLAG
ncbi:MAG: VWA domain-containing protein [Pseudomonadota bacterium]